jgi:hypothetical protein
MKKAVFFSMLVLFLMAISVGSAHADLDGFLSGLNHQANADRNDYGLRLSAQFGVPLPQVHSILRSVQSPADAFMCLQLGRMTNRHPESVLQTYNFNRGKGWGVIAKDLGIKPGSPEFHALKRGDFSFTGHPGAPGHSKPQGYGNEFNDGPGQGPDKEKGKGKGKGPK